MNGTARAEEALGAIGRGEMIIVVDDENRENEGDIVVAAEKCSAREINFMAREARGLICLAMTRERLERLEIGDMVGRNTALHNTAFMVSIDAAAGVTTGISAATGPGRSRWPSATARDPETLPGRATSSRSARAREEC